MKYFFFQSWNWLCFNIHRYTDQHLSWDRQRSSLWLQKRHLESRLRHLRTMQPQTSLSSWKYRRNFEQNQKWFVSAHSDGLFDDPVGFDQSYVKGQIWNAFSHLSAFDIQSLSDWIIGQIISQKFKWSKPRYILF